MLTCSPWASSSSWSAGGLGALVVDGRRRRQRLPQDGEHQMRSRRKRRAAVGDVGSSASLTPGGSSVPPNPNPALRGVQQSPAMASRREHDSMGEVEVPADARWGASTQRAVENFPISGQGIGRELIGALGRIKAAAAGANVGLGVLEPRHGRGHRRGRPRGRRRQRGTPISRSTSSRPARARRRT